MYRLRRTAHSLVLLVSLGTGCSTVSDSASDGATLKVGFGIGNSARTNLRNLTDVLYVESLLSRDWDGRQTGRLVTEWSWESDSTVLHLRLKPGVLLHDGTPLTPEVVGRILDGARSDGSFGFENVVGVTVSGSDTVTLRLSKPDMFVLNGLADKRIVLPENPDVGTGPFRLKTRTPSVVAERFDKYHGGTPTLSTVQIVTYDTTRSAWAGLMRDDVDAVQEVNPDSVEFMKDSSAVALHTSLQPFHVPLVFNLNHPVLASVEVRRAIAEALDRPAIVKRAMRGHGRVAEVPIWPNHWAYSPHPRRWEYAPVSARRRLDQAGFPMRGGSAMNPRSRFQLKCLVYDEDPQYERIALMVQRQLFDVGIELEIELLGLELLSERLKSGDFESYLMRVNAGRSMDFTYRFWHSRQPASQLIQRSGYSGADAALDQLRGSLDETSSRAAVALLAERFYEDVPAVFIAWLEITRAVSQRFDVGNGLQDPLFNLWRWRPTAQ